MPILETLGGALLVF